MNLLIDNIKKETPDNLSISMLGKEREWGVLLNRGRYTSCCVMLKSVSMSDFIECLTYCASNNIRVKFTDDFISPI